MIEKFSYHEALLGMTHVIGQADGASQSSEVDSRVQMILHEEIPSSTIEDFNQKAETLGTLEDIYTASLEALKKQESKQKVKACAWMYQVAAIAGKINDGDLDYDENTWIVGGDDNVDDDERKWINDTLKALDVSEDDLKEAFSSLPEVKRI